MAYIINVSKVSVSETMRGMWNIVLKLTYTDGVEEVINQDFSIRYKQGQSITIKVQEIKEKMQEAINDYKAEQVIFNHAQLDAALTWLQDNLEV